MRTSKVFGSTNTNKQTNKYKNKVFMDLNSIKGILLLYFFILVVVVVVDLRCAVAECIAIFDVIKLLLL